MWKQWQQLNFVLYSPSAHLPKLTEMFSLLLVKEGDYIWKSQVFDPEECLGQRQSKWEQPWS